MKSILWFTNSEIHENEGSFVGTNENGDPIKGGWYSNEENGLRVLVDVRVYCPDEYVRTRWSEYGWIPVSRWPGMHSWMEFEVPVQECIAD